jgi:YggT family protein
MKNFLLAFAGILNAIFSIFFWLILFRVLISWVNPDPYNPIVQFLIRVTEPVLGPIRNALPHFGGIDISPIVAWIAIEYVGKVFIVGELLRYAHNF